MSQWAVDLTTAGKECEVVGVWVGFSFTSNKILSLPDLVISVRLVEFIDDDCLLASLHDAVASKDVHHEHLLVLPFLQVVPQLICELLDVFSFGILG